MLKTDTIAKEYQSLLYGLFQEKIFKVESVSMKNDDGMIEDYIPKSVLMDNSIEILNALGELMSEDERLKNEI